MKRTIILLISIITVLISSTFSQPVIIDVNLDVKHTVGGIETFDRKKFINLHASPTEHGWTNEDKKMKYMMEDLDVYWGRDNGLLNWFLGYSDEDPKRPGYVDPKYVQTMGKESREGYGLKRWHMHKYDDRIDLVVGLLPEPQWPGHSCGKKGFKINKNGGGDWVGMALGEFFRKPGEPTTKGMPQPKWFEVVNEPIYHFVTVGDKTPREIFEYHNTCAAAVRKAYKGEKIMIGGYTVAFPYYELDNFQNWHTRDKLFMDIAGENMDFISMHFYDFHRHYQSGSKPNLMKGGHIEAILDMVEQYSMLKWGFVKPLLISEFGGRDQTLEMKKVWSAEQDWNTAKAISALILHFMERPDIILKTIPFVMTKCQWSSEPYNWRLMRRENEPDEMSGDWIFADTVKFYELWSDVKGTRVDTAATDPDISVDAYVDGKKAYVIICNLGFDRQVAVPNVTVAENNQLVQVREKQLYWDGEAGFMKEKKYKKHLKKLKLASEATAILEYTYADDIRISGSSEESKYYSDTYLKEIKGGQKEVFNINKVKLADKGEAVLRVSIGRDHNHSKQPKVSINGTELTVPDDFRGDNQQFRKRFYSMLDVPVPYSLLKENNKVEVSFSDDGGHIATVTMQVFNQSRDIARSRAPQ